jgi:hypothetical protein
MHFVYFLVVLKWVMFLCIFQDVKGGRFQILIEKVSQFWSFKKGFNKVSNLINNVKLCLLIVVVFKI